MRKTLAAILVFVVAATGFGAILVFDPAPAAGPRLDADVPPAAPGLSFQQVDGSHWWLQVRLDGGWADEVVAVEAQDRSGAWQGLAPRAWSPGEHWWAASLPLATEEVRFRAHLQDGVVVESCWHALDGEPRCEGGDATRNAVLVGFAPGMMPQVAVGSGLAGLQVLDRIDALHVLVVAGEPATAALLLSAVAGVTYVEEDAGVQSADEAGTGLPDDPRIDRQYGIPLAGFPGAWSTAGYGSDAVTVAVVDSGITPSHPDIDTGRVLPGHDYVERDGTPDDDCGHGTRVAGVLAASTGNGVGIAGAAQATVLPLKVLRGDCAGYVSHVAMAVVAAADQDADIISLSLGTSSDSRTLREAVSYAAGSGSLVVAAAGNTHGGTTRYPATYEGAIAVTAVDEAASPASYAARGPAVEVAAPGTRIESTTRHGGYATASGTSFAVPHVSGALALARSCAPGADAAVIRAALAATSSDLGPAGRDDATGHGLLAADRLVAELCGSRENQAPSARFDATPSGLSVLFDATASDDPDGDALAYGWDFGDGVTGTGATVLHTYAQAGTFAVILDASDGRLRDQTQTHVTVAESDLQAIFSPSKGVNEWWVEVSVTGDQPITAVHVQVDDGSWRSLPRTSWGAWAQSFHVPAGSSVIFRASAGDGDTTYSATYAWLGDPPPPGPFSVFFDPRSEENQWWVEVAVASDLQVTTVEVRLDQGDWRTLPATSWGTWAESFFVAPGTDVTFRAHAGTGETATSPAYTWG